MTTKYGIGNLGKWTGFGCCFGVTSVSLSAGFLWAKQGRAALTFVSAFAAWTGYLFAHYAVTGRFIDSAETVRRPNGTEAFGLVVGGAVLISGMVIGSQGIRVESFPLTQAGAVLFLSGYVIAHYATEKTLL